MSTSSSGEEVEVNHVDMSNEDVPVLDQFFWRQEQIRKLSYYVMSQVTNGTYMAPYNAITLNWDNVATEVGVDAAKCQHKWKLLLNSVKTYRTMSEIVLDILSQNSRQDIAKFNKSLDQVPAMKTVAVSARPLENKKKKRKVNPDHPKRPLSSGYTVYCQRKMKTVPQVGVAKMLKLAAMWKDLSESERESYNNESRKMKEKYSIKVEKYAEEHPDDKEIQKILREISKLKKDPKSKFTLIEPKGEVADTNKNPKSKFTQIEPKGEVADTTEDTLDDAIETNQLFSPKKSPNKKRQTEENELSQDSSPSKKKRKKMKKEKVWTGEDMFLEQKFEGYKLDHPDLNDTEVHSKLAKRFLKLAAEKTDKYKRKADKRNN